MRIGLWAENMVAPKCGVPEYVCRVGCAIGRARALGVELLVAPEYSSMLALSAEKRLPETREVRRLAALSASALPQIKKILSQTNVSFLAGTAPVQIGQAFYNRATLYLHGNRGIETYTQDKNNLTPSELDPKGWTLTPGMGFTAVNWCGYRLGVAICHDISSSEFAEQVAAEMPDIILVPSSTQKPNGVDGHNWIFDWCRKRSEQWACVVAAVGAVGEQTLCSRVEANIGGAAVWKRGKLLGELETMESTFDPIGPLLVVDI